MSDDAPKPVVPLEPVADPKTPPEKRTVALQDDRMWGGPQYVDGLPDRPFVTSKKQYFELLNAAGLRIRNQQESTTGPPRAEPVVVPPPPEIVVPPLLMEEAHIYGAVTAVFRHYDLMETVWCEACAARHRFHGCRMIVAPNRVVLACRCGHASYVPPVGTTDLVLSKLPNIARTRADDTQGTVLTATGPVARPTTILHDIEALLLRRYFAALTARHKEPRLFHRGCYAGDPHAIDNSLAIGSSPHRIVMICRCRTLYHQSSRVITARPLRVM